MLALPDGAPSKVASRANGGWLAAFDGVNNGRIRYEPARCTTFFYNGNSGSGLMSGSLGLDGRDVTDILGAFRVPGIVCSLHPGPDPGPIAKKLAQPDGDGR